MQQRSGGSLLKRLSYRRFTDASHTVQQDDLGRLHDRWHRTARPNGPRKSPPWVVSLDRPVSSNSPLASAPSVIPAGAKRRAGTQPHTLRARPHRLETPRCPLIPAKAGTQIVGLAGGTGSIANLQAAAPYDLGPGLRRDERMRRRPRCPPTRRYHHLFGHGRTVEWKRRAAAFPSLLNGIGNGERRAISVLAGGGWLCKAQPCVRSAGGDRTFNSRDALRPDAHASAVARSGGQGRAELACGAGRLDGREPGGPTPRPTNGVASRHLPCTPALGYIPRTAYPIEGEAGRNDWANPGAGRRPRDCSGSGPA